jgi:hypothetical protein
VCGGGVGSPQAIGPDSGVDSRSETGPLLMCDQEPLVSRLLFFYLSLATGVATFAIDVGSLFHGLTLRTAILSRCDFTGTDGMGAFFALTGCHMCVSLYWI